MKRLVVVFLVAGASGCVPFARSEITPAEIELEEITETRTPTTCPSGQPKVVRKIRRTRSRGPGLASRTGGKESEFETAPPTVRTDNGIEATGGGIKATMKGWAKKGGPMIFYGLAAISCLAGVVVLVWLKQTWLGLGLIGGAVGLVVLGIFVENPLWLLLILAAAAIGGVVWMILKSRRQKRAETTLNAVVKGVNKAEPEKDGPVKAAVKDAAGRDHMTVRAEVERVKKSQGMLA